MGFQGDDYQVGVCKHEAEATVPFESGRNTVKGSYSALLSNRLNRGNQILKYFWPPTDFFLALSVTGPIFHIQYQKPHNKTITYLTL